MNPWALWRVTLLNEGMSIRAHGSELCRTALKAINCRVMCDKNMAPVEVCC
jgi:hypothetical protein